MSPMPRMRRGHPVGVEDVEVLELLAGGREHHRAAGDAARPTAPHRRGRHRRAWSARRRRSRRRRGTPAAVVTASWPIIASTTNRISSGCTASRMSAACGIISASMPSRPAVSTMTTSCSLAPGVRRSTSRPPSTGSPTPLPGSGAKTGDPGPLAEHLQLLDGVGALQVGGDQQRRCALALEPAARACRRAWSYRSPAGRPA